MAEFKISEATAKGKTWKAVGINPKTGKEVTIQGGQEGTPVGDKNPESEKSFDARHEATGMTPKKYINKLRWDNKAEMNSTVDIPDKLFKAAKKKKAE
jgi:topoisomerase IA-like protein